MDPRPLLQFTKNYPDWQHPEEGDRNNDDLDKDKNNNKVLDTKPKTKQEQNSLEQTNGTNDYGETAVKLIRGKFFPGSELSKKKGKYIKKKTVVTKSTVIKKKTKKKQKKESTGNNKGKRQKKIEVINVKYLIWQFNIQKQQMQRLEKEIEQSNATKFNTCHRRGNKDSSSNKSSGNDSNDNTNVNNNNH